MWITNLNVNGRNNKNFRKTYYDIRVRISFLHRAQNDKLDNNGIRNLFIKNTLSVKNKVKRLRSYLLYKFYFYI